MKSIVFGSLLLLVQVTLASDCKSLANLKLDNATIASAESVAGGRFQPPYGAELAKVSGFCRIAGVISPTPDSTIRFEVWLPEANWNQKYLGVGNGGFAGAIDYRAMGVNLNRGYATAATDTGHEGNSEDASWAYHHPEKVIDFGYRALHETTLKAKQILAAFYSHPPSRSYFDSCSDGGREALMEAQRYPQDFDGILAGAPAYDWTHLVTGGIEANKLLVGNPASYISATKLPAITAASRTACDATDGIKDGLVSNPALCHFDPSVLRCKGPETRDCLTDPQLASLRRLYEGAPGSSSKGFVPGSEGAWEDWVIGQGPGGSYSAVYLQNYLRYMVYDDPTLNVLTVTAEDALSRADSRTANALNATDTDLSAFHARGGKLILYHGWYDPAIPPYGTVHYFEGVRLKMGDGVADQFVRLYMAPGVQHCFGGPGPGAFGQLGIPTAKGPKFGIFDALEQWVENGKVPGEVIATKYAGDNPTGKVVMTRPICPYPEVAQLKNGDNPNEASSFRCESSK